MIVHDKEPDWIHWSLAGNISPMLAEVVAEMQMAFFGLAAAAVSILLFIESSMPMVIFLKKMPRRTILRWQYLNRNRSRSIASSNRASQWSICTI
jgi:membrane protein implicated in regulation of membrane protease activity